MATHSTVWTGILSSSATSVAVGDAVVLDTNGEFRVATSANRTSYGRARGVAKTVASGVGATFEYQVAGILGATDSGVGVGTQDDWVIVNATGQLQRTATVTAGQDVVGRCPHTSGDVQVAPGVWTSANTAGGTTTTGQGFWRNSVAGVLDAAASAVNLAGGATHVTGTLPADQGGAMSRSTVTFADANQTILTSDAAFDSLVLKLTGSNTVTRDLIMPLPATAAASYVRVLEMGVTGGGVRLTMGAGSTWTLALASGGALHVALFTPDGVTVWGPAGTPASLGVQYVQANGYMGAVNIGTAGQFLKVNGTATGYEFGAGAAPGGSTTQVQYNNAGAFGGIVGASTDGTSLNVNDGLFNIVDGVDTTKVARFECTGITTGTTRVFTLPNATDTMAVLGLAQTFSAVNTFSAGIAFGADPSLTGTAGRYTAAASGNTAFDYFRWSGADYFFTSVDGTNVRIRYGNNSWTFEHMGAAHLFTVAGAEVQKITSTLIENGLPRVGLSTAYASEGRATQAMADANQTAAAAVYSRAIIRTTGALTATRTLTLPLPASEDASYIKHVMQDCTGGAVSFKAGAHATEAAVAAGARAVLAFTPDGVFQIAT